MIGDDSATINHSGRPAFAYIKSQGVSCWYIRNEIAWSGCDIDTFLLKFSMLEK